MRPVLNNGPIRKPSPFISKFISGGGSVPTPDVPVLGTLLVVSDTEITVPYTSDYPVEIWYSTDNITYTKHGDSASTPYPMTGLTANITYYVKIRAKNGSKYSDFTSVVNAKTIQPEVTLYISRIAADSGTFLNGSTGDELYLNNIVTRIKASGIFTNSSLLMIPSAYKTSKLYSILPTDGTGDFIYTRAASKWGKDVNGNYTERASNNPSLEWDGEKYVYVVELAGDNIFTNSLAPVTRTITVLNATLYSISCLGSGSVTLSDALEGVVTYGNPLRLTTSGTSLTLTISGTITHVQVEASSGAITSPMYSATTFHRNRDIAKTNSIASLIGQTEGTIYVELNTKQLYPTPAGQIFAVYDTWNAKSIFCYINRTAGGYTIECQLNNTTNQADILSTTFSILPDTIRLAIAYSNNDLVMVVNGFKHGSDTSLSVPSLSYIELGSAGNGGQLNENISLFAVSKTRIADNELILLTDRTISETTIEGLTNYKAAVANLVSNDVVYDINFHGDSITEGLLATTPIRDNGYVGKLRDYFEGLYGDVGIGAMVEYAPYGALDFTFTGTWSNIGYGFTALSKKTVTLNDTASFSFIGTSLDLITIASNVGATHGDFTVAIDDGDPVTFTNLIGTAQKVRRLNIVNGLSDTTHNVIITNSGGKELIISAAYAAKGSRGFRCNMIGQSGIDSTTGIAGGATTGALASAELLSPVLSFIGFITNDTTGAMDITLFKSNIQAIIDSAKKSGDVIILANNGCTNKTVAIQKPYVDALYELATLNECTIIDIYKRWNLQGQTLGLMADVLHPNSAGMIDISNEIVKILTN